MSAIFGLFPLKLAKAEARPRPFAKVDAAPYAEVYGCHAFLQRVWWGDRFGIGCQRSSCTIGNDRAAGSCLS